MASSREKKFRRRGGGGRQQPLKGERGKGRRCPCHFTKEGSFMGGRGGEGEKGIQIHQEGEGRKRGGPDRRPSSGKIIGRKGGNCALLPAGA